ncbi:MAG: NAD(P)-binding domain-containing protein [Bacteriovoracaceae bacterium]|nr:NAD(P)-binding domain-containing protein [Bacteriovoracaceae bacterium]
MKVLVLGAGKMTEAILTGLKKTENLSEWMIYSPSGASAQKLAGKVGARAVLDLTSVKNPDWVLVGCKPQQLPDLKNILNGRFKESLFISILAALSEEDQLKILEVKELIRVMPNLPVEFNEGISLLASHSAKTRLTSMHAFFAKLGTSLIVAESELEELTLLTGSGPAFFYEFARNLAGSFESLDESAREKLVRQVFKGSAKGMVDGGDSLAALTDKVTSKGGVTIAVLNYWREASLAQKIKSGIEAGKKRSAEIRATLRN